MLNLTEKKMNLKISSEKHQQFMVLILHDRGRMIPEDLDEKIKLLKSQVIYVHLHYIT